MENGPDPLAIVLPIVGPLLFVGVMLFLVWRQAEGQRKVWSAFAARRDWDFSASKSFLGLTRILEAQGLHRGYQVSVMPERRGKKNPQVTVVRVDLSRVVPWELALTPEDRLFKFFGGNDAELGDAALDGALEMQGVTPAARELLQGARVRRHLLEAHQSFEHFSLVGGLLEAVHRGVPKSPDELESVMAPVFQLVDALDEAARHVRERRA
jgi:hypothetical protein